MCGILLSLVWKETDHFEEKNIEKRISCAAQRIHVKIDEHCEKRVEKVKSLLTNRGPDHSESIKLSFGSFYSICIHSSVLHMTGRGCMTTQPLTDATNSNILAFNGEIYSFDGEDLSGEGSDTQILFKELVSCHGDEDLILQTIAKIRGPFAFVFIDVEQESIWFGRDILGRRSLCWTIIRNHLIVSSVGCYDDGSNKWSEVPCTGIFRLMPSSDSDEPELSYYNWNQTPSGNRVQSTFETQSDLGNNQADPESRDLHPLISSHSSVSQTPLHEDCCPSGFSANNPLNIMKLRHIRDKHLISPIRATITSSDSASNLDQTLHDFQKVLSNSIRKRISHFHGRCYSCKAYRRDSCSHSNIGILFSGGIDSTVIALIADDHVSKDKEIDLLNVSFTGESAPDRVTARSALEELTHLRPHRKWRLILIDPTKQELADWRSNRIKHLIYPLETVLDDSIGCSIWFAASGNIQIQEKETSSARILLHGLGSDEQLAGYSRHRRIFDKKGLIGLEEELKRELDNLHTRNLGRDDRLVSDHGKEVRYPFLEEDVISFLNSIPISIKCDLTLPRGEGEKKLLRQLAQRLGLHRVSQFEKRAIQFGTRISKIVNEGREKGDMKCSRLLD